MYANHCARNSLPSSILHRVSEIGRCDKRERLKETDLTKLDNVGLMGGRSSVQGATESPGSSDNYKSATSIHEFTVKNLKGEDVKLDVYKGHVCIIVNVASQCGLTAKNYQQLNEIYEKYAEEKGLRILAFPCNQFAGQEPGNSEKIVCSLADRRVKFDIFEKINVNGKNASPLWKFLKYKQGGTLGSFVKWNFTKFIIDKDGVPVERHGPNVDPVDLIKSLEKYW